MKNLIEVTRIVTKKKIRKIEILDETTLEGGNSKFSEFYEALLTNKFKNDRDAATYLYDCSPTDDKYRQLKSRFRKRLLNTLFFLDVNAPSAGNYDRAYFSSNKDWTLVKILLANDAPSTAEDLAKQILTTALRYKFADVIVNCCRILRHFAAENNNENEYETYDGYIKEYSNILEAEVRSEELFQRVMMKYRSVNLETTDIKSQIDVFCDALVGLSETYDSPVVFYNMYLVWAYRYEMLYDFEAMLAVCGQAEKYIEANPEFYQGDKQATFQIKKMSAYLHLRDFKNGRANAEKSLQNFPEGSAIWFEFMEYYLLLAFHTDNFISAFAILNRAKGHAWFKKLDLETKEKWKIFEIYLAYLIESSEEDSLLKQQSIKNFRPSRFINDPILFPKEQRVFTVHLVIVQVFFLLDQKNYALAHERVERLRNYASKQLKKEENYRLIQFIRLVVQLSRAEFQINDLVGADKFYERLVEQPFYFRGLINELEIIPYEKLWNLLLAKLG